MEIFGLEKLSLVDYDGKIGATVFTGTCNFRCGFCHNSLLVLDVQRLPVLPEEEILSYLSKRKGVIEGVCISGGEPTLQKDLPAFCEKIKKLGYCVKLDTNGTSPETVKLLNESGLCDYFAMDIKNDKDNYASIIGFDKYDTQKIEKTVDYFLSGSADYEFRTTLIKEYHNKDNIIKIGEWLKGANKYFMQKFKASDSCILGGLSSVEDETAKEFLSVVAPYVKHAALRGYDL